MPETKINTAFERFKTGGHPDALAYVFDQTAGELLRIASHLSRDLHVAEDLVQTTFLVAIERRDLHKAGADVLPWLVGILTNRARERRRQDGRTLDAAQLARPEVLDPAAVAEASELSDAMLAAIGELPTAYQPVLNLHLRYGLAAAEIAETLGRPPGTVRTQLVRGMDLLRAALPVGLAGVVALVVPPQVLAAMRSRVLEAVPKLASTSVVGTGIGGLWLSKKMIALFVAGFVTLLSWFAWSGIAEQDAPSVESASSVRRAPVPASEETRVIEQAAARVEIEGSKDPSHSLATVRGRCVDAADQSPLAGCAVTVTWRGEDGVRIEPPGRSTTQSDGLFSFQQIEGAAMLSVRCDLEGRAPFQTREEKTSAGGLDLGDVPLPTSCRVSGHVLDESGKPVEGLSVGAADQANFFKLSHQNRRTGRAEIDPCVTDRAGRFELTLYAAAKWQFNVSGWRQISMGRDLSIRHGQKNAQVELRVGPDQSQERIAGVVVDKLGQPVADAEVGPRFDVLTDAQGRFSFSRESRENRMAFFGVSTIQAKKQGYQLGHSPCEWGDTDIRIVLRPGIMVDLLVTDAQSGEPVTDYGVRIVHDPLVKPWMPSFSVKRWMRAGYTGRHEGGRTRIGPLTRGWTFVQIEPVDPRFDPYILRFASADAARTGVEIPLYRAVSRSVKVVDGEGAVVAGCNVELVRALRDFRVTPVTRVLEPEQMARLRAY
ncbi:MAG: sigma-70 family RNA polymerase sigma factor, partial [bacterium]|nr:sigma-70 family RNA polymerase sigma factor [bacterium]